jgi:Zn finger protein HypA/HybF involved in hydrogenase expression
MHEMSLAEGVLQLVEDTARRENAQRVKLVVLEIGRLSIMMIRVTKRSLVVTLP